MNSSNFENISYESQIREEVVPSRKRLTLPPWLEVAKPRLIPLLLATTLGGMALTEEWPLSSPKLICTLGGGALAAAAAGALNCLWEMELDKRMTRTSKRGINLGFATSSHGGNVTLFLEGTTSSLIEDL